MCVVALPLLSTAEMWLGFDSFSIEIRYGFSERWKRRTFSRCRADRLRAGEVGGSWCECMGSVVRSVQRPWRTLRGPSGREGGPPPAHDGYVRHILTEVASGEAVSQRSLAKQMGIAVGLTNLLLRRIIRKGWVRMIHVKPSRFKYFLTQAGMAEKARMSRDYVEYSVRFYAEMRDRIVENFSVLSAEWPVGTRTGAKRVAFFGAGEVAEIGYVCLQSADLTLVGVVDETRTSPFFGMLVHRLADLSAAKVGDVPFERLVVMALDNPATIKRAVESAAVPAEAVFWLRNW